MGVVIKCPSIYGMPVMLSAFFRYEENAGIYTQGAPLNFSVPPDYLSATLDGGYVAGSKSSSTPYLQVVKYVNGNYSALGSLPDPGGACYECHFSSDGLWLAVAKSVGAVGTLLIYRRDGDTFTLSDSVTGTDTLGCCWNRAGTKIAWIQRESVNNVILYSFNSVTGKLTNARNGATSAGFTGGENIDFDPQDRFIVIGGTTTISIYDSIGSGSMPLRANFDLTGASTPDAGTGTHWNKYGTLIYTIGRNYKLGNVNAYYRFNRGSFAITGPFFPPQPASAPSGNSAINALRNRIAFRDGSNAAQSIYVYDVNEEILTAHSPQPVTSGGLTNCITFTELPPPIY